VATNAVNEKTGAQFTFADHATDFVGGTALTSLEQAGSTDVQLDTTSVNDTAARESTQVDLTATRAAEYTLKGAVEMAATPTTNERIDFYWNASPDSVAGNGNMGYTVGVDGAYVGGVATLAEGLAQLKFIGSLIVSADATTTVQVAEIGTFSPQERFGSLVVVNESGAAFHSDAVETHFALQEVLPDIAAAA